MRALFLTQHDVLASSSRTRVYQFLPHLEREGVRCKVISIGSGLLYKGALLCDGHRKLAKALYFAMSW